MFCGGLCSLAWLTRVTLNAGIVPRDLMTISFIHQERSGGAWATTSETLALLMCSEQSQDRRWARVFVAENSSNVGTNSRAWLMTRQGRAGDF